MDSRLNALDDATADHAHHAVSISPAPKQPGENRQIASTLDIQHRRLSTYSSSIHAKRYRKLSWYSFAPDLALNNIDNMSQPYRTPFVITPVSVGETVVDLSQIPSCPNDINHPQLVQSAADPTTVHDFPHPLRRDITRKAQIKTMTQGTTNHVSNLYFLDAEDNTHKLLSCSKSRTSRRKSTWVQMARCCRHWCSKSTATEQTSRLTD